MGTAKKDGFKPNASSNFLVSDLSEYYNLCIHNQEQHNEYQKNSYLDEES